MFRRLASRDSVRDRKFARPFSEVTVHVKQTPAIAHQRPSHVRSLFTFEESILIQIGDAAAGKWGRRSSSAAPTQV